MPKPRNETPAQREARLDAFERDAMPVKRKPNPAVADLRHTIRRAQRLQALLDGCHGRFERLQGELRRVDALPEDLSAKFADYIA